MKINAVYMRVSTEKQSCDMQLHSIKTFLENKSITDFQIYQDDDISGSTTSRAALNKLVFDIKRGAIETLTIYKLDRLCRSLSHLLELFELFKEHSVKLVSISDNIDLATPQGVFMLQIMGAVAEFERGIIKQRVIAGLANAKAKGIQLGAAPTIPKETRQKAIELRKEGLSYSQIAKMCSLARSTTYKIITENTKVLTEGAE